MTSKIKSTGYLYAILMSDGLMKVGRTKNKIARLSQHRTFARNAGLSVVNYSFSELLADAHDKEQQLMSFCRNNSTRVRSREWFYGANFDDARKFILSFKAATKEEIEECEVIKKHYEEKVWKGACNILSLKTDAAEVQCDVIDEIYKAIDSDRDRIESNIRMLIAINQKHKKDKDEKSHSNLLLIDSLRHLKCCLEFVGCATESLWDEEGVNEAVAEIVSSQGAEINSLHEKAKEEFISVKKNEDGFVFRPADTWRTLSVDELKEIYGEDWE